MGVAAGKGVPNSPERKYEFFTGMGGGATLCRGTTVPGGSGGGGGMLGIVSCLND